MPIRSFLSHNDHEKYIMMKHGILWVLLILAVAVRSSETHGSRRILHLGRMEDLVPSSSARRRSTFSFKNKSSGTLLINSHKSKTLHQIDEDDSLQTSRNKLWPPWPFNLIGKRQHQDHHDDHRYPSTGALFWAYLRQRARIGIRQLRQLGSELWFHLPPATPPLVLLTAIPFRTSTDRRIPTLFTNAFCRNLVLASLGLAVMTWAHAELDRKRMLEPLPLPPQYQDVARAFLPPFLPEDVELQDLTTATPLEDYEPDITRDDNTLLSDTLDSEEKKELPQRLKRHLQNIYEFSPKPHTIRSTVRQWRLKRLEHKVQAIRAKRLSIYDELVALQALKKKAAKKRYSKTQTSTPPKNDLGYALVTGASRGIGRALAVELARWEIPLILVARDEDRLIQLATDIEQCYGVKCCILTADLSKPDAAFQIHRATTDAGLKVDILINNAGLSSSGEFVDMDDSKLHSILQVNTMSVAQLSRLYGSDMKNARRGRILIVSSVVGATYSGPTVAAYTATKAFEKVLGLSMAKELEVYGVGVTNLLPGAVADSSFRQRSGTVEALCWKLPGYPKTSEEVADHGVRALLGGDIEVIPGWHNRVFIKILHPILPQRAITLVMEAAWNPLSHWRLLHLRRNSRQREITTVGEERPPKNPTENLPILSWPGYSQRSPPRILKIEEDSRGDTGEEESEVPALLDASGEVSHSSKESESENTDSTKEYQGTEAGTEADEIVKGDPATKSEFSSREEMQAESGHVLRDHTIPPSGKSRHTDDVANPENEGVLYAI